MAIAWWRGSANSGEGRRSERKLSLTFVARCLVLAVSLVTALSVTVIGVSPASHADPSDDYADQYDRPVRPLPVVTPVPSNWEPKFPFPYDQTRGSVTDAEINAEREMCQWFTAQYDELTRQINRLQYHRITPYGPGVVMGSGSDGDYSIGDIQQEVDIVTGNIDQSIGFLTPRVESLTQTQDHAGDLYFPLYQGNSFYRLWEQLFNVNDGIKSHQPDWFSGPSVHRMLRWGSRIHRSHVCQ